MEAVEKTPMVSRSFGINPTDGKRPTDLSLRDIKRKTKRYKPTCRGHLVQVPVFVTDLRRKAEKIVFEYDGRANIESLIEESKNQIAMAKILGETFCGQRFIPASRHVGV